MTFLPLPLLGNPHVQTILGTLVNAAPARLPVQTRLVPLPDGDTIVLHETPPRVAVPNEPIVLLVHGLGGSSNSPYMPRLTKRLCGLGWRVFRMNLRGAGAGLRLARRFYNAACSHDVRAVIEHLAQAYPEAGVALAGFSLGGNIVLKLAGEAAEQPVPSLRAVAAVAPPIDLIRCSELMAKYPYYDAFFVHNLTTQVREHQRYFPDLPRIVFPRRATLRQFDDLYTAPRWGYADALDYYRQASAVSRIGAVRLPTYILTARDDPFVAVAPFEAVPMPPSVELHITAHGGHLGFLGRDETGGVRWAETQIANWLAKQVAEWTTG